jgi:phosphatidylinositol glycan class B
VSTCQCYLRALLTRRITRRGQDKAKYRDQSDFFYESPTNYLTTRFPPSVDPSFPPSTFTITSSLSILAHPSGDLGWNHTWPSHFVLFQTLLESSDGAAQTIGDFLESKGYRVEERIWNSHWQDDDRRNGDVVLLRWFAD